jgi:hypothetical protein
MSNYECILVYIVYRYDGYVLILILFELIQYHMNTLYSLSYTTGIHTHTLTLTHRDDTHTLPTHSQFTMTLTHTHTYTHI